MAKINIQSVNDKLLDKYIRHSVWMEQLKAGEAAAISKMLKKEVFPQLYDKLINELGKVKNLKTAGSIRKIKRIKQMMASVETSATAGAIKAGKLINNKMYDVAKFEAKWNKSVIEKTVPLDISLEVPSNAVLKQLVLLSTFEGHRMQTWMKGYSRSVQAGIAKQLKAGVATGESLPKIAKRLRTVLGQKAGQAETLARTAVSNIVHDAREATFVANKELIRKVQIVATLDDRTTLICINYDGQVYNVGEGDRPPFHFNCRSTTVPIVTSWNEYGIEAPPAYTRASMNGAVPSKINYRQWLKKQSKATQIKVLGKKRQALYASGKVKINRFVGKDYKPLTLKQLYRREKISITQELKLPLNTKYKFENINPNYGKQFNDELNRLSKRFPEAEKRLAGVEMLPPKEYRRVTGLNGTAVVKRIGDKDKIFINGEVFLSNSKYDAGALTKVLAKKKAIVGENVADHIIHEFGHVVENTLPKSRRDKLFDFLWYADAKTLETIKSQISNYAAETSSELFAESFTQWQIGKVSPMAKKVLIMAGLI